MQQQGQEQEVVLLPHHKTEYWERMHELLSKQITTYSELEEVIKTIKSDLVPDVMAHFTLDGLKSVIEEAQLPFFDVILPALCELALRLPKLFPSKSLPRLLTRHRTEDEGCKVNLSREQVACLVANMFFCTFGESDFHLAFILSSYRDREYGQSQAQKVRCILHYFHRITTEGPSFFEGDQIIYHRRTLLKRDYPFFEHSNLPLCEFKVMKEGKIDDATDCTMIDFANEQLGGGAVQFGCTQEEIIFMTHPECLPALLLAEERMKDDDVIIMRGVRRICKYSGYMASFKFEGNEEDETPREFVAVDAVPFVMDYEEQFLDTMLLREVIKAYCGFLQDVEDQQQNEFQEREAKKEERKTKEIATGNWGCGAFCGDLQLKSLIQWIAASQAQRAGLRYFVFEKQEHGERLNSLIRLLIGGAARKATVRWLWNVVSDYVKERRGGYRGEVFDFVAQRWIDYQTYT